MLATNRRQMHEELDKMIDLIEKSELTDYFLPDLQLEYTNVDEHEQETILTIGVEFAEMNDGTLSVEERYIHSKFFDEMGKPKGHNHQTWEP